MKRSAAALVVVMLVAGAGWWLGARPQIYDVAPGEAVGDVAARLPEGSVLRLLPGMHAPFALRVPVSVVAEEGAVVRGPVEVLSDGIRLTGLHIVGGENGITVREADDVELQDVAIEATELHGIEIASGSASITDCQIGGLLSPYAQGIEVRNSNGRPRTVVRGCVVHGGREGIVSHVSRVEFLDNVVQDSTLRAIAITEMSEGMIEGNRVEGVAGIALYCGDMSHCEIADNSVSDVAAAPRAGTSEGGYPVVGWYHSVIRVHGNKAEGFAAPEPVRLTLESTRTDQFPLAIWPPGWRGAIPGVGVVALALGLLLGVRFAVAAWLRRRPVPVGASIAIADALPVLLMGLGVQTFHMTEHIVQVWQVYVAESPQRSGVLGAAFDVEWVHFIYNSVVLVFLLWSFRTVRRANEPLAQGAAALLGAAFVIQCYHVVEHVAKMAQHLATGAQPAPGIIGGRLGLVWFHFGINLAVWMGSTAATVMLLAGLRRRRIGGLSGVRHPSLGVT